MEVIPTNGSELSINTYGLEGKCKNYYKFYRYFYYRYAPVNVDEYEACFLSKGRYVIILGEVESGNAHAL